MCRNHLILLSPIIFIILCQCVFSENRISSENVESVWHSYQFNIGYGNRKELFIRRVEAVQNFSTHENVVKWRTLSVKDRLFSFGQTENGVLLLSMTVDETIQQKVHYNQSYTPMNGTILDAFIFQYWNVEQQRSEVMSVVAVAKADVNNSIVLQWFRIEEQNNKLITIWQWQFYKNLTHMNVFKLADTYNILIAYQQSPNADDYNALDWYTFHLSAHNDFWLKQSIKLSRPIYSTAISFYERQTFLSLPQGSHLEIYKLSEDNAHFEMFKRISVDSVSFVKSVKIGMQTYLLIDGPSAGIYKFAKGDIIKQRVDTANLHNIDYWLSIPISTSTMDDEEILIAEKNLDFVTHQSPAIQAIIHHGGHFILHEEMECDYFGETSSGLDCLVEAEKGTRGIKGSAFFNVKGTLGVLVPRTGKPSSLFMLHTEIKQLKSPVVQKMQFLDARREELQARIDALQSPNKDGRKKRQAQLDVPQNSFNFTTPEMRQMPTIIDPREERILGLAERISKLQVYINDLEKDALKLPKLQDGRSSYGTVIINNVVEVEGPCDIDDLKLNAVNEVEVDKLLSNVYNVHDKGRIEGEKTFLNLQVSALEMETINGIQSDKLSFRTNPLVLHGDVVAGGLVVEGDVKTGTINNVSIENEVIFMSPFKHFNGTLNIRNLNIQRELNIKRLNNFPIANNNSDQIVQGNGDFSDTDFESVFLPGNISVTNINSEHFDRLVSTLCFKNIETYIPNSVIVEGDVIVKDEALTLNLNSLQFPQEYVVAKPNSFTQITAKKIFANELIVDNLTIQGKLNGIVPNEVITLSGNQKMNGKLTFDQLQVTNSLKLDGEIVGLETENLLPNPTLFDSNHLNANVVFKQLEVTGKIIIGDVFNGSDINAMLSDVIYKVPHTSVDITSMKTFPQGLTVLNNLQITSNFINNVDVNSFIHKDTDEILNMNKLYGDVTFENLNINGTFGGIDVVELDQDAVKLSGEQFITSKIVFEDAISANEIDIMQTMNDIPLEDHLNGQMGKGEVTWEHLNLGSLRVGNLIVLEDLHANEPSFNITHFATRRFSLTREQSIDSAFSLNASRIEELKIRNINEQSFDALFNIHIYTNKMIDMLFAGQLQVSELVVNGSIEIENLNNIKMHTILKNCLNSQGGDRRLELYLENAQISDLTVDKFNGLLFEEFKSNLVFKGEDNLQIFGLKQYLNGFEVKNYIQTTQVNKIPVHDILRNNGQQEIMSPIVILGDVTLEGENHVSSTINNVPIENITNAFEVIDENHYRINGDVVFPSSLKVVHLSTKSVNSIDIQEYLRDAIYLGNENCSNLQNITFNSEVSVTGNLNVNGKINRVNLNQLKNDLVLISKDATVQYPVQFNDVVVKDELEIESDLLAKSINGFNPENWMDRALFINKGKILGTLHFRKATIENDLRAQFVNNINMSNLVNLRGENVIESLSVKELVSFKDIQVSGEVNGARLEPEYQNSALSGNIHLISDNVIFKGNALVRKYLDVMNFVNEHDLARVVTTDTDQNLTASFQFNDKSIANDIWVQGNVNNNNITKWTLNGVKTASKHIQTISNQWNIDQNLTFEGDVNGYGFINGLNIRQLSDKVEHRRNYKANVENDLANNYKRICNDIYMIQQRAEKQIFKFKYLDFKQAIELEENIKFVHHFKHMDSSYIIIKEEGCHSKVFQWIDDQFTFAYDFESGNISQIVNVPFGDEYYLISRDSENSSCTIDGTNVWKFDLDQLILFNKLQDQQVLHASRRLGSFYGLEKGSQTVYEFRIVKNPDTSIIAVEKWNLPIENATFMPQGLKTGLALRNAEFLVKLNSVDPARPQNFDPQVHTISIGNFTVEANQYIPKNNEDMLLMKVGYPPWKTMLAVATHEETIVKGRLDHINIYDGPLRGSIFHKVPTYKPSSMVSLEFGDNGETLLIFLENRDTLQVFEYKGIEGFRHRSKLNIVGNALVALKLPTGQNTSLRNFVGVLNGKHFTVLEAVMDGDKLDIDALQCAL